MRTGAFDYETFVSNILNKDEAKTKEILVNTFKVSGERADLINDIYEKISHLLYGKNAENIVYSFDISLDYVFALERNIEALLGMELANILDENVLGLRKEYWDCVEAHRIESKDNNPA